MIERKLLIDYGKEFYKSESLFNLCNKYVYWVDLENHPYCVYKFRIDQVVLKSYPNQRIGVYLNCYPLDMYGLKVYRDEKDFPVEELGRSLFYSLDAAKKVAYKKLYMKQIKLF